jgi:hypothetical protein
LAARRARTAAGNAGHRLHERGRSPEDSAGVASAFRQGLADAGFIEGQTVKIEYRWANGDYDKFFAIGTGHPFTGLAKENAPPMVIDEARLCFRYLRRELQSLSYSECYSLGCFDLDRLAGSRVAAHARSALLDLQDPKTRNSDSFTLLQMFGDEADEVAKEGLTSAFCYLMVLGQSGREMFESNGVTGI